MDVKVDTVDSAIRGLIAKETEELRGETLKLTERIKDNLFIFDRRLTCRRLVMPPIYQIYPINEVITNITFKHPDLGWISAWDQPVKTTSYDSDIDCTFERSASGQLTKGSIEALNTKAEFYCTESRADFSASRVFFQQAYIRRTTAIRLCIKNLSE